MSRTYEVEFNAVDFLFGVISSQRFADQKLDPTVRFQAKKFLSTCKQLPEYGEKHGYRYFGADFEAPLGEPCT